MVRQAARSRGRAGQSSAAARPGRSRGAGELSVDASGNLTWSWRAAEHLDPVRYPLQPHYRREHWPLINGVYPLADGTVAASLRSVSAVIIIDRASGEISWRLGPDMLPSSTARASCRTARCCCSTTARSAPARA
jgi:hypothetical protein